jgi:uncharacterized protein
MAIGGITRDDLSEAFFDAAAEGRLLIKRCDECTRINGPTQEACCSCYSPAMSWHDADGSGTIVALTLVHGRGSGPGSAPTLTASAIIELLEGPWLHARVIHDDPRAVAIGQNVHVVFEQPASGETVPAFRVSA